MGLNCLKEVWRFVADKNPLTKRSDLLGEINSEIKKMRSMNRKILLKKNNNSPQFKKKFRSKSKN